MSLWQEQIGTYRDLDNFSLSYGKKSTLERAVQDVDFAVLQKKCSGKHMRSFDRIKPFDKSGMFQPVIPECRQKLRSLAVRGVGVTIFSGGVGLAIQIIATAVLARLLAPADFGVVAMVTTFSLLLVNFGFNGITEAIVQRDQMDHQFASTLFWMNLLAGSLLTIVFAASGSLLAMFYHNPLVKHVTEGIALTIFATSLSVVHLALLKRAMLFSQTSVNDIVARTVSVTVSILLGLAGWGHWALVAGTVALPVSTSVGAWVLCNWVPGMPRLTKDTRSSLWFAINTYGSFLINYFSRNTDNLLVGWRFDAQSLGFYKKAYDLFALSTEFVASITLVVVAALSRIRQNMDQYRSYLLASMTMMAFVGMGLSAGLTLFGKDLIRVLLGPKWASAGQVFTFFGPGIGAMMLYTTHSWIHLSIGRADRWLRWGIVQFLVTCSFFLVALRWGPVGIALAWTSSFWILALPAIWYAGRPIEFGIKPVLRAVWRYPIAALSASAATAMVIPHLSFLSTTTGVKGALLRIVVISTSVTCCYLTAVIVLHGGCAPLYQMARLLREMGSRTGTRVLNKDDRQDTTMPSSFQTGPGGIPHRLETIPVPNTSD